MKLPNRLAAALSWLGRKRAAPFGGGAIPAAPVLSGTYVNPSSAMSLAAVYSAINVISRDVASLPCGIYSKLAGGGLKEETTHPLHRILRVNFNDEVDAFRGHRDTMGHTLGWGNGLTEIVRSKKDGRALDLELLHPAKTKAKRNAHGRLYYELDNDPKKTLLPENVLHFAGLGFNGLEGHSPITVARQTIGLGLAVEQMGAAFYGNSAIPKGVLKTAKRLKEEAANNLRRSINEVHQGSQSAFQFLLLEEGLEWQSTQIPPEDSQFLLTRGFQVLEIARLYNLPPHKIGDYSQAHLANVEESNLDYLTTTLVGWVVMREAQMNWKLLTTEDRKKLVILHDFTALLRGSMAARVAYYQGMRNMGCMSADDIRAKEGLNPIGAAKGGDLYIVQGQYLPLEQIGKNPLPAEPVTAKRFAEVLTSPLIMNGNSHE